MRREGKNQLSKKENDHGRKALLTTDVREHACYPDDQDRRPDYLSAVVRNLINRDFVKANG